MADRQDDIHFSHPVSFREDQMTKIRNNASGLEKKRKATFLVRSASGEVVEREMEVATEHILSVSVNGIPAFRLSCTPGDLAELVLGRLYTERLIRSLTEVEDLFICGKGEIAEVTLSDKAAFSPAEKDIPTCCTGNESFLSGREDAGLRHLPEKEIDPDRIFRLSESFRQDSELHRSTGGTHSCYILNGKGEIRSFEDVGRHNALDKAVGHMLLSGYVPEDCILFTTGRVAADLIVKAIASGIPILVSKAVPTDEAIRFADEYGMKLIVRAWPDSCWEAVSP